MLDSQLSELFPLYNTKLKVLYRPNLTAQPITNQVKTKTELKAWQLTRQWSKLMYWALANKYQPLGMFVLVAVKKNILLLKKKHATKSQSQET